MKRCKAEYLLIKMILLKSLICKDFPFTLDCYNNIYNYNVIIFRIIRGNVYHAYITCIWMDISLSSGRLLLY